MTTTTQELEKPKRWRPPPQLGIGGPESILGLPVVEERPDALGMTLWRTLRCAVLAAGTAPDHCAAPLLDLKGEEAGLALAEPPLRDALVGLLRIVETPLLGSSDLAAACRDVSGQALEAGLQVASLYFMELAATLAAGDPEPAFLAGRAARRRAEYARATGWFREAITRARLRRDRVSYARALTGLGNLYLQRGNIPRARECHLRAYRVSKRYGHRERQAMASHDLFVVFDLTDDPQRAERYAAVAARLYGPMHPRFPSLANDVAVFWIGRGEFARALPVLEALLPLFTDPRDTLVTLGNIARAAGAIGEQSSFDRARSRIEKSVANDAPTDATAAALLDLARGAASLGEWEVAEDAANRAVAIAEARREGRSLLTAESVAELVANRRRLDDARSARILDARADDPLVAELLEALGA